MSKTCMKCKHIDECRQKVSVWFFKDCCLKGRIDENTVWHQDDCFRNNDAQEVDAPGELVTLKLPREWQKEM